jgi:hypothetical protein
VSAAWVSLRVCPTRGAMQEHFSAANLIRSLFAEHWHSPHSSSAAVTAAVDTSGVLTASSAAVTAAVDTSGVLSAAKVIIFMRQSADLAAIGVGGAEPAMMQLLRAAVGPAGPMARSALCILQLRAMLSAQDVSQAIGDFLHQGVDGALRARIASTEPLLQRQRLLLLLADMSVITAAQLNSVRQQVGRHESFFASAAS